MSLSHLVHHRIEKIRRERPELLGVLDFIEVPMHTARAQSANASITLNEILEGVVGSFDWLDADTLRSLVSVPKYNIRFRKEAAASLAIIIETLVENCRAHSDVYHDTISIRVVRGLKRVRESELRSQPGLLLRITYEAKHTRTQLDLLDRLTIAPVWEEEDRSYHFGMFLLGAHARLWGGLTYVDT